MTLHIHRGERLMSGTASRNAAIEQAITDEGWTRRKEMVKGGEYAVSDVERTVTVSADGRFTIYPSGSMRRVRSHGAHGDLYNDWRWEGYRLAGWIPGMHHGRTVRGIKRDVARWRLSEGQTGVDA